MTIEFPRRLMREESHDWNVVGNVAGSGQTTSGSVSVRTDGGGLWMASINVIRISNDRDGRNADTNLWRAVRQICNGGVTPIIVPRNDVLFRPWPVGLDASVGLDVPHDDDSYFSDDADYHQTVIDIACGPGALRATTLDIAVTYAGELVGGEAFSIEHPTVGWRMYEIATVEMSDAESGVITFNPPLREAVSGGTKLEFDRPRCLMKLATPGAMDLNVTAQPYNQPSVKFIETKYGP